MAYAQNFTPSILIDMGVAQKLTYRHSEQQQGFQNLALGKAQF